VDVLPRVKKIERFTPRQPLPSVAGRRVLVAVGQHLPFTPAQEEALGRFALRYDAVVYTNHLSNYHGPNAVNASVFITNIGLKKHAEYRPDLVITIGGQIGDYDFDGMMRRIPFEHWRVHEDGMVRDTYGKLTKVFEFADEEFFATLATQADAAPASTYYADLWAKGNAERSIPEKLPLSHAFVAAELAPRIPPGSIMHFAILSSFRNWSFFELDPTVESYSNVAAFGIDGCLSTFIGHAAATDQLSFLVIGDLSFFYDMNAIGIRGIGSNARVILVNNGGGGEFRLYSNAADKNFGEGANEFIAAAGHNGPARAWVESMGWDYAAANSKQDVSNLAFCILEVSERPRLLEVFTTMQDDSDGVRVIREANTIETLEQKIKKALPPGVKRVAKSVLGR
jgi:2-succinyl-5-enolpyruvyl-6-hydroxy-3-cyclohexene-1-carboxylate synthase